MYSQPSNEKKYFYIIMWALCCLFLLIPSSALAKNVSLASSKKDSKEIKNTFEVLAQRFDTNNGDSRRQNDSISEVVESITEMEKALQHLRESFEHMRGDQSISTIRGRNGMRGGMHGKRHGGMGGMGHGRMHGRKSLENTEPQCPQPRNTLRVPDSLYNLVNPLENTPDNIEAGRVLFQMEVQPTCTMCHGFGDGRGVMADSLSPPPRNFSCKETMGEIPDGQLFGVITNGSEGTGMPAFFDLNDDQIWKLILYIRSLAK